MMNHLHTKKASMFYSRGLTLVETLVAVSIVALSVVGPLTFANRALNASYIARDQLIASSLAQEGIEYVRAMKSAAFLENQSDANWWDDHFVGGSDPTSISNCTSASPCTVDALNTNFGWGPSGFALTNCSGTCPKIKLAQLSPNVFKYTQDTVISPATTTAFTRTVRTIPVSGTEVRIDSIVNWVTHGTTYTIVVSSHLTPWE